MGGAGGSSGRCSAKFRLTILGECCYLRQRVDPIRDAKESEGRPGHPVMPTRAGTGAPTACCLGRYGRGHARAARGASRSLLFLEFTYPQTARSEVLVGEDFGARLRECQEPLPESPIIPHVHRDWRCYVRRVLVTLALSVCLPACSKDSPSAPTAPPATTPTPVIALSEGLAFGNVEVGTTRDATFTITNVGDSVLTVSGITEPSGYSASWPNGSIAVSASQTVPIRAETSGLFTSSRPDSSSRFASPSVRW